MCRSPVVRNESMSPAALLDRFASYRRGRTAAAGVSLIEMLTTVSILAVLLAIASPGLASLTSANALSAAQGELASAMMLARTEAVRRSVSVGLAATAPVAGAEFSGGWTVFVDLNENRQYDEGEPIVRQQPSFPPGTRVATANGATAITFNGRGFLTPSTLVTFTLCSRAARKGYQVRVEPVGLTDIAESSTCY